MEAGGSLPGRPSEVSGNLCLLVDIILLTKLSVRDSLPNTNVLLSHWRPASGLAAKRPQYVFHVMQAIEECGDL